MNITKPFTQPWITIIPIYNLSLNRTTWTFFKSFVVWTFPRNFLLWKQSADGNIPSSRRFITTVTGLVPTEIIDSESSVSLYNSNSITCFLSCCNNKTINMQNINMFRGLNFYLSKSKNVGYTFVQLCNFLHKKRHTFLICLCNDRMEVVVPESSFIYMFSINCYGICKTILSTTDNLIIKRYHIPKAKTGTSFRVHLLFLFYLDVFYTFSPIANTFQIWCFGGQIFAFR